MEQKNNKLIYLIVKSTLYIIALITLAILSNFWIGSDEKWNKMLKNEFFEALFVRSIFLTIIGLFFIFLSYLINLLFKRKYNLSKELLYLLLLSFLINLFKMIR